MPPSNSRNTSPPAMEPATRAALPPSYFSALQDLESPVLNLAATLTTQADDDLTELTSQYFPLESSTEDWSGERMTSDRQQWQQRQHILMQLQLERSSPPPPPPPPRPQSQTQTQSQVPQRREDLDQRERLRRVMNRLSRIHDPPATASYGDRIPSQNNLYDWSPANEADDEDELDQILAELRREQPNTHPEILRVLGRSQLDAERESRTRSYSSRLLSSNQPSQTADSSLRSAAILQSVRRHPRFSARTRDYMQRYPPERDSASRSPHQNEPRERHTSSSESARHPAMLRLNDRRTSAERTRDRDRDILSRVNSFRRTYLGGATTSAPPTVSHLLEETIKYLSQTRYAINRDDSLHSAFDAGLLTKEYFYEEDEDFVLDTITLSPPAETSWLAPGAVLSGCQHATTVTTTITSTATGNSQTLNRFRNNESMSSTLFDSTRPWPSHSYTSPHRRNIHTSGPETVTSHSPHQDRWPVKVTIHAVDYSKMTLSATMEAYNVPSHPHSQQSMLAGNIEGPVAPFTRTSSITTYLEGEILDFNQHTLLTESFKSSATNDATYWRKLPPFQKFTDDELVRNLTSKRYLTEVLNRDWILMRWKERCFVKSLHRPGNAVQPPDSPASAVRPTDSFTSTTSSRENRPPREWHDNEHTTFDDSGCGLTISGFYYVCLRRSDGKLEGLYYDPQSSPYQCLKLDSVNGGIFPAWQFR